MKYSMCWNIVLDLRLQISYASPAHPLLSVSLIYMRNEQSTQYMYWMLEYRQFSSFCFWSDACLYHIFFSLKFHQLSLHLIHLLPHMWFHLLISASEIRNNHISLQLLRSSHTHHCLFIYSAHSLYDYTCSYTFLDVSWESVSVTDVSYEHFWSLLAL